MSGQRDVVVFLEPSGERALSINAGLLTEGGRLAGFLGGRLRAAAVGSPPGDAGMLEEYGVSTLYRLEGKDLSPRNSEVLAWAIRTGLGDVSFRLLLFAQSDTGSEVAPRVAYALDTAAVMDCFDIRVKNGTLLYVREVYKGRFEQEVSYAAARPEIAAIRTDALFGRKAAAATSLRVVTVPLEVPADIVRTTSLDLTPPDHETVDIVYAKRIIGVGSGCGPLRALAEELSRLLHGSIGTTRPVVDDGEIPKKRMIGQTGKTVSPELYLALGVSGSPHHVAGIQQSGEVISVNLDPRAPIFNFSDAGFVGDLHGLLPKLIGRIKRYRDEGLA